MISLLVLRISASTHVIHSSTRLVTGCGLRKSITSPSLEIIAVTVMSVVLVPETRLLINLSELILSYICVLEGSENNSNRIWFVLKMQISFRNDKVRAPDSQTVYSTRTMGTQTTRLDALTNVLNPEVPMCALFSMVNSLKHKLKMTSKGV